MKIELKFGIREYVYIIFKQSNMLIKKCEFCKDGKIIGFNKVAVVCPVCNGRKKVFPFVIQYNVLEKTYIENIIISDCGIAYYTDAVASIRIPEKDVFKFKKDAVAEAEKRNKGEIDEKIEGESK